MQIKIPIELPDDWLDRVVDKIKEDGDFVLVTRCGECKWLYMGADVDRPYCINKNFGLMRVDDDFYCPYGERKENDQD